MSSRPAFRLFATSRTAFQASFRQPLLHRRVQTAAEPSESAFAKLWNSPVGPKTVHFWAPIMKWGVVLAGVSDFARPAESLSLTQNSALMATGAIWTRWCLIIKPKNIFLATVNFFLFCVGATQVGRIFLYRQSLKGDSAKETAKDAVAVEVNSAKKIVKTPEGAAANAGLKN